METEDQKEMKLLRDPSLKENPFRVPEGYFDQLAGRLKEERDRQDAEAVPQRQLEGRSQEFGRRSQELGRRSQELGRRSQELVRRRRIALAAAVVGLALLSYPIARVLVPAGQDTFMEELALMDGAGLYYNDYALVSDLYEAEEIDDDEAFASLAEDYLAMGSRSLDLYIEIE